MEADSIGHTILTVLRRVELLNTGVAQLAKGQSCHGHGRRHCECVLVDSQDRECSRAVEQHLVIDGQVAACFDRQQSVGAHTTTGDDSTVHGVFGGIKSVEDELNRLREGEERFDRTAV